MASPQTLSEADRRCVAAWAADCAERVLPLFEAEAPGDGRPRDTAARAADCLEVNRFLRESRVGLEPIPLPVELPRTDPAVLAERRGIDTTAKSC